MARSRNPRQRRPRQGRREPLLPSPIRSGRPRARLDNRTPAGRSWRRPAPSELTTGASGAGPSRPGQRRSVADRPSYSAGQCRIARSRQPPKATAAPSRVLQRAPTLALVERSNAGHAAAQEPAKRSPQRLHGRTVGGSLGRLLLLQGRLSHPGRGPPHGSTPTLANDCFASVSTPMGGADRPASRLAAPPWGMALERGPATASLCDNLPRVGGALGGAFDPMRAGRPSGGSPDPTAPSPSPGG